MSSKDELEELKNEARHKFEEDPSLDAKELAKELGLKVSIARALARR